MLRRISFFLLFIACVLAVYVPTNECFACLNPIPTEEFTHFFQCEHINIHQHCIDDWVRVKHEHASCPLCRAPPLIPITPMLEVSSCLNNATLLIESTNQVLNYIDNGIWADIQPVFASCEFPRDYHYLFMRVEASNGKWETLKEHIAMFGNELVPSQIAPTLEFAVRARRGDVMKLILARSRRSTYENLLQVCIRSRFWVCTHVIVEYYARNNIIVDLGSSINLAAIFRMPSDCFKPLIALLYSSATLSESSLLAALVRLSKDRYHSIFFALLDAIDQQYTIPNESQIEILANLFMDQSTRILNSVLRSGRFSHQYALNARWSMNNQEYAARLN